MDTVDIVLAALIIGSGLAILGFMTWQFRRIIRKLRTLDEALQVIPMFVWASSNLQRFVPVGRPLPNWNHWSMPPDLLATIASIIIERNPRTIVEFGSGLSTIVIGSLLRERGGRLISLEHDHEYGFRQKELLMSHDLLEIVDLRIVPIDETRHEPFGHRWYDIAGIDDLNNVDLVIVDGPPQAFGAEVRYPCGDLMVSKLRPGGSIVFDDAARPGEQRIKRALVEKYPNLIISEPTHIRGCLILTKPE